MNNYTLNQLYFEAMALIEKYQVKAAEGSTPYVLNCLFDLKDDGSGLKLQFGIILKDPENSFRYLANSWGDSPAECLSDFTDALKKVSDKKPASNKNSGYSVDLPGTIQQ